MNLTCEAYQMAFQVHIAPQSYIHDVQRHTFISTSTLLIRSNGLYGLAVPHLNPILSANPREVLMNA